MNLDYFTYKEAFTDWDLVNEQGIIAADLNRIEGNTLHIYEFERDNVVELRGGRPSSEFSQYINNVVQPTFISIEPGSKLMLDSIMYTGFVGSHIVVEDPLSGVEIFNSLEDNSNISSDFLFVRKEIAKNETLETMGRPLFVWDILDPGSGGGIPARSWDIRFTLEKIQNNI